MDSFFTRTIGLGALAGIALSSCAGFPITAAPKLTCAQIADEKDRAYAALDVLFPKLQAESHQSVSYWIDVFFPTGSPVPTSHPNRAAAVALGNDYEQILVQARAQHCSPPLPDLEVELMTRAYIANKDLFHRFNHPSVRRVGGVSHKHPREK